MDQHEQERRVWQRVLGTEDKSGDGQAEAVLQVLKQTLEAEQCYLCLAGRTTGCCQRTLQQLAREKRCQAKQLETVYFLLTGCCAKVKCCPCNCCGKLCCLIRARWEAEQRASEGYCTASERFCQFSGLYACLSRASAQAAKKLRCVLQELLSA